jgi:hypothetical protein
MEGTVGIAAGEEVPAVDWGDFRRNKPISSYWGLDRGRPIDRYYIESFLSEFRHEIRGHCLEVENPGYTRKYGEGRVEQVAVLDIDVANPQATVIGDLSSGSGIPANAFDSFVLTQTLQLIYDVQGAIDTTHRLLKPGGVVLATVPGITPVPVRDPASSIWCWSFTVNSVRKMFEDVFGPSNVLVRSYGNVLSATSFLWGLAIEDLTREELEHNDPDYQVTIAARARKPGS